ncbi:MAG: hypothetical protein AB8B65_02245 [Kordia sp.]|uniref:hypothetical protein n=1 Tax=Kordia sp. TaxID=1965332 RepID=UPI0038582356
MKTRFILFVTVLICFVSCREQASKNTEKVPQQEVSKDTVSPKVNAHESEIKKEIDFTSRLEEKVQRLSKLEHKYQIKNFEKVSPAKTILFGGLQRMIRLRDTVYKDIDLDMFKNGLHEVSTAFLKGAKPMQPNGNLYPRVTIEEYIFKTPEIAKTTFNMLKKSQKHGSLWMYISKAPHDFFLEENRMYIMISGGHYMMGIYKDIAEKIKK